MKTNLKELKPTTSMKKQKREKQKSKRAPKLSDNVNTEYRCLICSELYIHPPTEDWIRCDDCELWAHEACTHYCGRGFYYCDMCDE